MFNLFRKDPLQRLNKEYARCLEQARDLQRKGDIKGFNDKLSARVRNAAYPMSSNLARCRA